METAIDEVKVLLPYFMKHKNVWSSYDSEADVLYMHFKKPSHADNAEITEDDIIVRYENDEIIGFTVLNASKK
jgi:uncharacterized protein YuzE